VARHFSGHFFGDWRLFDVRPVLVLLLLVAHAHAEPARCVVAGRSVTLQEIAVKPPGAEPFQLGIDAVPAIAHLPSRCGAPLDLDIGGALVFSASRENVRLSLAREITTPDGLVTLKRGAEVIDACMRGDRVIASAILENDDVLAGENKPASQQVKNIEIPCDALTLDAVELAEADFFMGDENARQWELRDEASSIALFVQPNTNAPSRIYESPSCVGCIKLDEVRRTRHWVLVEASGLGVAARGWVRRSLVKQLPDEGRTYGGLMCTGDHGGGGFWGESPSPSSVEREATVRVGTTVYAGEGTSAWGTFARDERVKVRITQGSPWAELRRVSGLDGDPSGSPWLHGVVSVDALKLDPTP
jgi:hypothetical protein